MQNTAITRQRQNYKQVHTQATFLLAVPSILTQFPSLKILGGLILGELIRLPCVPVKAEVMGFLKSSIQFNKNLVHTPFLTREITKGGQ